MRATGPTRRWHRVAFLSVVVLGLVRFSWNLWRYSFHNRASDTLLVFPAPRVADWAGVRETFFVGQLAQHFYEGVHAHGSWSYGPLFHLLTLPMVLFDDLWIAYRGFLVLTVITYLTAAWLLFKVLRPEGQGYRWHALFALLALNYYPAYNALTLRAIEVFELLFVVVAMWFTARGGGGRRGEIGAGMAIALGALAKFVPGVLVVGLFVGRRWVALASTLAAVAVGLLLAHVLLGLDENPMFTGLVPSQDSTYFAECGSTDQCTYSAHAHNQALSGFLLRTLPVLGWEHPAELHLQVAILLSAVAIGWWVHRHRSVHWTRLWAVLLTAAVLLVPKNEYYYYCMLLMPFAVAVRGLLCHCDWRRWVALGVSYTVIGVPLPLGVLRVLPGVESGLGLANAMLEWSLPFLGAVLLLVVLMSEPVRPGPGAAG